MMMMDLHLGTEGWPGWVSFGASYVVKYFIIHIQLPSWLDVNHAESIDDRSVKSLPAVLMLQTSEQWLSVYVTCWWVLKWLRNVASKLFAKKVEKLFEADADDSGLSANASTLYRCVLTLYRCVLSDELQITVAVLLPCRLCCRCVAVVVVVVVILHLRRQLQSLGIILLYLNASKLILPASFYSSHVLLLFNTPWTGFTGCQSALGLTSKSPLWLTRLLYSGQPAYLREYSLPTNLLAHCDPIISFC